MTKAPQVSALREKAARLMYENSAKRLKPGKQVTPWADASPACRAEFMASVHDVLTALPEADTSARTIADLTAALANATEYAAKADARIENLTKALAGMFMLHEPEGRFQPSHYKGPLLDARKALAAEFGMTMDQVRDHLAEIWDGARREFLKGPRP